jgi:hypothetical protein
MWVEFTSLWFRVQFTSLRLPGQTIHTDLPFTTSNCSHTKPYCKLQGTENIPVQFNTRHRIQHCTNNSNKCRQHTSSVLLTNFMLAVLSVVMLCHQTLLVLIGLSLLCNNGGSSNCTETFQCPLYSLTTATQVAHHIQHWTHFHTYICKLLHISNICYF